MGNDVSDGELTIQQVQKVNMEGSPVQMNLPWGLTQEDLRAIHRSAEDAANQRRDQQMDNDMQEVRTVRYAIGQCG